jgi:hypothetical protein
MTSEPRPDESIDRREAIRHGAGLVACAAGLPLLASAGCTAGSSPPAAAGGSTGSAAPAGAATGTAGVTLPSSVAGVPVPDSHLAVAAATLARTASPENLFNHVMRTYLFAAMLFDKRRTTYDRELVFVGCALHDLGLLDAYMTPFERFEVDGADAAKRFMEHFRVPPQRAEIVWDAIALHTELNIAQRKAPEIAMVSLGAIMDAAGLNLDQLPEPAVGEVLAAFPRLGFKRSAVDTMIHLCQKKPLGVLLHPFAEVGRRHLPDFKVPTIEDLMLAAPFPE